MSGHDFNSTRTVTARVEHRCEECNRAIERGEQYHRTAAVCEGSFFTFTTCAHCAVAREVVDLADGWYCDSYYGGLREWLHEMGTEFRDEHGVLRVYVGVRAQWRYQSGALMPVPDVPTRESVA